MVSERTRNLAVGLTMLFALIVLMYGILLLGQGPTWFGKQPYAVTVEAGDANGLTPGSKVNLQGIAVGEVKSVELRTNPDGSLGAHIVLLIDNAINIPSNANVAIGKGYVGSSSYVTVYGGGGGGPKAMLPHDGSGVLHATNSDNGLIPKEVFDDVHELKIDLSSLTVELTQVAKDMHTLLKPSSPEAVDHANPNDPNRPPENISTMVTRLSQTIKSLQQVISDPTVQSQVRQILKNLADSTDHLQGTLVKIDNAIDSADKSMNQFGGAATQASSTLSTTQQQILIISEKLVQTLDQLQKTTRQISEGNGTTGKLINDPRLYDGLVDLSKSLHSTVDDLDLLVKKWNDEGLGVHFGK
jgi:ABC-type transporter Mla subunit MlaD